MAILLFAQPETNLLRLHRLVDHFHQLAAQRLDVGLIARCSSKLLQRLLCVVLAAVEAPVDEK